MWIPDEIYSQVLKSMPIPCVDLLVTDETEKVLLVRRKNPPAEGQWWLPGGRVHHGELRAAAAGRKLKEECGLEALELVELGTHDLLIEQPGTHLSHGISTVYLARVRGSATPRLDSQSSEFEWRHPKAWLQQSLHEFVRKSLLCLTKQREQ